MKKISIFTIVVFFGMTSCKKTTTAADTSDTMNVALAANTAYTYNFTQPAQNISITTQASNARISSVSNFPATLPSYQYVPDSNYVGGDSVTIVVSNGPPAGCHAQGGNCKKHGGNCTNSQTPPAAAKTVLRFKFTIGNIAKN